MKIMVISLKLSLKKYKKLKLLKYED